MSASLPKAESQSKQIWDINEDIIWLSRPLLMQPARYYDTQSTVTFSKEQCCPVVIAWAEPTLTDLISGNQTTCLNRDVVGTDLSWYEFGFFLLGPKSNHKDMICREDDNNYVCTITSKYQWFTLKYMKIYMGFLCYDLDNSYNWLTLKGIHAEITINQASNNSQCEPIIKGNPVQCEKYYDYVSFPNIYGQLSQKEAAPRLELLASLFNNCHQHINYFLCQAVFPQCPPPEEPVEDRHTYMTDHLVVACAEMCSEVVQACNVQQFPFMQDYNCTDLYYSKNESDTCVYKNVTCDQVPFVKNAKPSDVKETYYANESIIYTCDGKYNIEGNPKITCEYSGKFSKPPKCVFKIWIFILPAILIVLVVVTILMTFLYCLRQRKKLQKQPVTSRKRPYDAFVSYNSEGEDQDYVILY